MENSDDSIFDLIAHVRRTDRTTQSLKSHLENTGKIADCFTSEIGLYSVGETLGLLHDLGKASKEFNEYLLAVTELPSTSHENLKKGTIDHSTAGAQFINKATRSKNWNKYERIAIELLQISIMSHHGGLMDCIREGKDLFRTRLNKSFDETHLTEAENIIDSEILYHAKDSLCVAIDSLSSLIKDLCENVKYKESRFRIGLLARFLLSCLVDADRIDTADFEYPSNDQHRKLADKVSWSELKSRFYEHISKFDSGNDINVIRKSISDQCNNSADRPKGTYTLSVPTGGGKTLSSLRFAIEHLEKHHMKRIIYIVPYTTIIDQNAGDVRKILERDNEAGTIVLEHHSNLDPDTSEDLQTGPWRLSSENWDSPIIFTTMVQFQNALFSSGTKNLRRMHNLSNSIVIFDEIQTIQMKVVYMFNETVNFLTRHCGSTVLLCTATQPLLDDEELEHPLFLSTNHELIENPSELANNLKRVEIIQYKDGSSIEKDEITLIVNDELIKENSILIIVNTKRMARDLFENIRNRLGNDITMIHLSTNMCPAHREIKIREMKKLLIDNKKLVCVSTQLMEAGIDIDFNVVIRSLAGLDSIAQAAGRCNRNNKKPEKGKVYVVNLEENTENLDDIHSGIHHSKRAFREYYHCCEDMLSPAVMRDYFGNYLSDRIKVMAYPIPESEDMFTLLSTNDDNYHRYKKSRDYDDKRRLIQSFKRANELFAPIETTRSIIVPYNDESRKIISDLCSENLDVSPLRLLRRAQRHSINIYEGQFEILRKKEIIVETKADGIYFLLEGNYDDTYGVKEHTLIKAIVM